MPACLFCHAGLPTTVTATAFRMCSQKPWRCSCRSFRREISGIPEIVTDGVDGVLIDPGDTDRLAREMKHLLTHPACCQRLGEAARKQIASVFDSSRTTLVLKDLFLESLNGTRAP